MSAASSLVIGAGGLLGSAVLRRLGGAATPAHVPWGSPEASSALRRHAADLSGDDARPWQVYWCAGAGVNGTSSEAFAREIADFTAFLDAVVEHAEGPGALFLASSAGGVYAGSASPPFTEEHATRALSAYGETKLAMEEAARDVLAGTQHVLAIGRIANLYGPGQNLSKMQGLISHIGRALVTDQPLNLFVPIDTIRDYIYVDDAADMIVRLMEHAQAHGPREVTKIISSGRGVTIGELIGLTHKIAKRRPPVVYAASPLASFQSSDLRLRSLVLPELDSSARTSLDVGLARTTHAIESQNTLGLLAR